MLTKKQIEDLPKGFHPHIGSNRKQRRKHLQKYGIHNAKKHELLLVTPMGKMRMFTQAIWDKSKEKFKFIEHCVNVN